LTLKDVDKGLSEDNKGKHLWMLIVAHYIQSGKLIFTDKHHMLRNWSANNSAMACLHGLRLCGRSLFANPGMKLLYARRGGEAHISGQMVLQAVIEVAGQGCVFPIQLDNHIIEQVEHKLKWNVGAGAQWKEYGWETTTVIWSWLHMMMNYQIVSICHPSITADGKGYWWQSKAIIFACYNRLYETETVMEGTTWINAFIENPDDGSFMSAILKQVEMMKRT
jgi:hypothetical protein